MSDERWGLLFLQRSRAWWQTVLVPDGLGECGGFMVLILGSFDFVGRSSDLSTRFRLLTRAAKTLRANRFQLTDNFRDHHFFQYVGLFRGPTRTRFLFSTLTTQFDNSISSILKTGRTNDVLTFRITGQLKGGITVTHRGGRNCRLVRNFAFRPNRQILVISSIAAAKKATGRLVRVMGSTRTRPIKINLVTAGKVFRISLFYPIRMLVSLRGVSTVSPRTYPLYRRNVPLAVNAT